MQCFRNSVWWIVEQGENVLLGILSRYLPGDTAVTPNNANESNQKIRTSPSARIRGKEWLRRAFFPHITTSNFSGCCRVTDAAGKGNRSVKS